MDGNGRWARNRKLPRTRGHRAGVAAVKKIVRFAPRIDIKILTLFTFSTENWRRPIDEVKTLMSLLSETTKKELDELVENGVRLIVSGDMSELPFTQRKVLSHAIKRTASGDVLTLNLALNYGGRAEILAATKKIAEMTKQDEFEIEQIDEEKFASFLQISGLPDPELLVRTGGELRISNFMLWQSAYAELYFTDVMWPDFDEIQLCEAVLDYASRERRFGGISGAD